MNQIKQNQSRNDNQIILFSEEKQTFLALQNLKEVTPDFKPLLVCNFDLFLSFQGTLEAAHSKRYTFKQMNDVIIGFFIKNKLEEMALNETMAILNNDQ